MSIRLNWLSFDKYWLGFNNISFSKKSCWQVRMICKIDEVWVVWTLIYIHTPPVINNLIVVSIWVVLFNNSIGTSFNYFSALWNSLAIKG
jgi:hypothetical protein